MQITVTWRLSSDLTEVSQAFAFFVGWLRDYRLSSCSYRIRMHPFPALGKPNLAACFSGRRRRDQRRKLPCVICRKDVIWNRLVLPVLLYRLHFFANEDGWWYLLPRINLQLCQLVQVTLWFRWPPVVWPECVVLWPTSIFMRCSACHYDFTMRNIYATLPLHSHEVAVDHRSGCW